MRTILRSEYARMDVATGPVFDAMCSTSFESLARREVHDCHTPCLSATECVGVWPIVAARNWYYGAHRWISIDETPINSSSSTFPERGDAVTVYLFDANPLRESLLEQFDQRRDNYGSHQLHGVIQH